MTSHRRNRDAGGHRHGRAPDGEAVVVLHEAVAQRAYELFIQHGRTNGHDLDDWLEAERELRNSRTGVHE